MFVLILNLIVVIVVVKIDIVLDNLSESSIRLRGLTIQVTSVTLLVLVLVKNHHSLLFWLD